jgi:hypothetical protein
MFRSLFHDHPQGSSSVLSASTTYQPPASSFVFFGFVAVCPLFVCVSGLPVCVLSGRAKHDQTTHRQLHRKRLKRQKRLLKGTLLITQRKIQSKQKSTSEYLIPRISNQRPSSLCLLESNPVTFLLQAQGVSQS